MADLPPSEQPSEQNSSRSVPRWMVLCLLLVIVVLSGFGGYYYLYHTRIHPHTDDAYVHAHIVNIAAQVSGPIKALAVQQYDQVGVGDLLFEIDPEPFALAEQQANEALQRAMQANDAKQQQVAQAALVVAQRFSQLGVAKKNAARMNDLIKTQVVSQAAADKANSERQVAQAALKVAQRQWQVAKSQLGGPGDEDPAVRQAKVGLAQATLALKHTKVYAPADGQVGTLPIRVGTMIEVGAPLFAIVETGSWWVTANFKETQMSLIRPGQAADVQIDFPKIKLKGIVTAISRGSGSSFSLMPAENATGNWVKVTQRFSVRIALLGAHASDQQLHDGASAAVVVHTNRLSTFQGDGVLNTTPGVQQQVSP